MGSTRRRCWWLTTSVRACVELPAPEGYGTSGLRGTVRRISSVNVLKSLSNATNNRTYIVAGAATAVVSEGRLQSLHAHVLREHVGHEPPAPLCRGISGKEELADQQQRIQPDSAQYRHPPERNRRKHN